MLKYDYAMQTSGDISYFLATINLQLLKIGIENYPNFTEEFESFCKYSALFDIATPLMEKILDKKFDSCDLYEEDKFEVLEIDDELFNLVSSHEYLKSELSEKVDVALEEVGFTISGDIFRMIEDAESNGTEFTQCEMDMCDYEEEYIGIIRNAIQGNTLKIFLYYTEDLVMVVNGLMLLKDILIRVKEELDECSNKTGEE